jgi:hypothetical protein
MKIPSHFVEIESDGQFEAFHLEDGVGGGDGLLANLANLLLDVVLVELYDGGRAILRVGLLREQNLQGAPGSASRVGLALIGSGE